MMLNDGEQEEEEYKMERKKRKTNQSQTRRSFVKKALVGAAAGTAWLTGCTQKKGEGPAVVSRQKLNWKMVTTWPKNFPALGTGANRLAQSIEELSDGQIKVRVYGAGELVPALGSFDAVSRGTAELGHGAAYYWKGKHEAAQFFAAVPFGLNAQEMNAWLYFSDAQKLWDELYAPFNLKPFPAGNTGVQMGGWFKKEIRTIKDFKGLKMRMPGLGGEVIRQLGATVVTLPGGETFQSLKSGAIDASEWIGPYNDLAFGFHKAAKNYYWPGWHEPGTALECFVNKKVYDALPTHLQQVVAAACEKINNNMLAEFSARNVQALDTLVKQHGVRLKRFSPQIMKALGKTSKEVVASIANKDPFSKKVYTAFEKFRKQAVRWNKISEESYSQSRGSVFGNA